MHGDENAATGNHTIMTRSLALAMFLAATPASAQPDSVGHRLANALFVFGLRFGFS